MADFAFEYFEKPNRDYEKARKRLKEQGVTIQNYGFSYLLNQGYFHMKRQPYMQGGNDPLPAMEVLVPGTTLPPPPITAPTPPQPATPQPSPPLTPTKAKIKASAALDTAIAQGSPLKKVGRPTKFIADPNKKSYAFNTVKDPFSKRAGITIPVPLDQPEKDAVINHLDLWYPADPNNPGGQAFKSHFVTQDQPITAIFIEDTTDPDNAFINDADLSPGNAVEFLRNMMPNKKLSEITYLTRKGEKHILSDVKKNARESLVNLLKQKANGGVPLVVSTPDGSRKFAIYAKNINPADLQ